MKNYIFLLSLLFLLNGCNDLEEQNQTALTMLIFQTEYTNYAWGYNHQGWMLNNSGQVKRFLKSANWVFPDKDGYISSSDMQKNMAACDSVTSVVTPAVFESYASKALNIGNETLGESVNEMFDAGEVKYVYYRFDPAKDRYQMIVLSRWGDFKQDNLASNASGIVEWMKSVK